MECAIKEFFKEKIYNDPFDLIYYYIPDRFFTDEKFIKNIYKYAHLMGEKYYNENNKYRINEEYCYFYLVEDDIKTEYLKNFGSLRKNKTHEYIRFMYKMVKEHNETR